MPSYANGPTNANKPWHARLTWRNRKHSLGYYKTWEEARLQELELLRLFLDDEHAELQRKVSA